MVDLQQTIHTYTGTEFSTACAYCRIRVGIYCSVYCTVQMDHFEEVGDMLHIIMYTSRFTYLVPNF